MYVYGIIFPYTHHYTRDCAITTQNDWNIYICVITLFIRNSDISKYVTFKVIDRTASSCQCHGFKNKCYAKIMFHVCVPQNIFNQLKVSCRTCPYEYGRQSF